MDIFHFPDIYPHFMPIVQAGDKTVFKHVGISILEYGVVFDISLITRNNLHI